MPQSTRSFARIAISAVLLAGTAGAKEPTLMSPADVLRRIEAAAPTSGDVAPTSEAANVLAGIRSITIYYRSVGRRVVAEVLEFDAQKEVIRGAAHWAVAK